MGWNPVETQQPHVVYAAVGFGLLVFASLSRLLRNRLYLGEVPLGTLYGLIVGPHCLKWIDPTTWGNTDLITIELSRVVLVNEVFTVGLELPPKYTLRRAYSLLVLLVPVMTFGWLISSIFFYLFLPELRWIDGLAAAGCVTATDPVLSAVLIGKGKFGDRLGDGLRHLLSAESAANDGMALPFVYIAMNIIKHEHNGGLIALNVICVSILYTCVLSCLVGAVLGYSGRHLMKYMVDKHLLEPEWSALFHFAILIFGAGITTMLSLDDLLFAFAAGSAFGWDGWYQEVFAEQSVADIITNLLNVIFFFFFGTIVPWEQFNTIELPVWRLICLAIVLMFVRRIPALLAVKPLLNELVTWGDALLAGHFGPIGVCALFMVKMLNSELEQDSPIPASSHKILHLSEDVSYLLRVLWPATCFIVLISIIVHGGSLPLYALAQAVVRKIRANNTVGRGGVESTESHDTEKEQATFAQLRDEEFQFVVTGRAVHDGILTAAAQDMPSK